MTDQTTTTPTESTRRGSGSIVFKVVGVLVLAAVALWVIAEVSEETDVVEETIEAASVTRIAVDGEAGNITIVVEDRSDIEVVSELTSSLWAGVRSQVETSAGTLTVTSGCDIDFLLFSCSASHTIRVPLDTVGDLDLSTAAGTIEITGASSDVDARTTAGDIELSDFSGTEANLRTTAGGITLRATAAPDAISAQTTAGEIVIAVPDEVYAVETDTTAGDVTLNVRTDPGAERTIFASTTAGEITITTD